MNLRKIVAIAIPIVILVISVPIFMNNASNLQQINQEKENAKPSFISLFQTVLDHCSTTSDSNCKQSVQQMQQQCNFYDNPPVCNDPRINEIMKSTT